MKIAVQPDFVTQPNGEKQSFSRRWIELAQDRGIETQTVNVFSPGAVDMIRDCDGFMWRYGFDPVKFAFAKKFLSAIEHGMRIPVFPNWKTSWHFEDKIAQGYLLSATGIASPDTWTFWKKGEALEFCRSARYPFVVKLAAGIRSNNVVLVRDFEQARSLVDNMFGRGIAAMRPPAGRTWRQSVTRNRLLRRLAGKPDLPQELRESGYFYAQEFLADNAFDTRVTIIGNRAFAFRRFNREGDFRASGSGRISWDPEAIDLPTVRLAFKVAKVLGTQSVAIDGMRRGDTRLVNEISYTYAAWAIRDCPGHWLLSGDPDRGELTWIEGQMRAEDAIFDDFIATVRG